MEIKLYPLKSCHKEPSVNNSKTTRLSRTSYFPVNKACEMAEGMKLDSHTGRPRTPNDQYTVLSDEQIRNIPKVRL